ncbi:MAG: branched-chain amino acid aminotransferase [Saprospiraceae bacterium]|nr:branched-chain amino acid aminotransferase [Saprospiraceae bacterium]
MKPAIKITKTNQSRINEVDFDNIPFGRVFSDHMFVADYYDGQWQDYRIVPFANFEIHPASMVLHYGQSIFEGMKASVSQSGKAMFLSPELHAQRLNTSAERMCMPTFPEEVFLEALHALVNLDQAWIPPQTGSALYIRPLMFATDEFIGVKPSHNYRMLIFTGPVGPYYPKPVSLLAEDKYIRAAVGGVGAAKTAGNYAASLLPARLANEKGYDQVLWLDGKDFKYVQEVGTMNIFFVLNGKVITPPTDENTILKGITRKMAIQILEDNGYQVEVRKLSMDEIVEAYNKGQFQEAFGTGTAAVVAKVSKVAYKDMVMELDQNTAKIGQVIKDHIDGLRNGTVADKWNWIVPVKEMAAVEL